MFGQKKNMLQYFFDILFSVLTIHEVLLIEFSS